MTTHTVSHDWHDFVVRTIPGAIGTTFYAFTELGPVAWITILWVGIQIVHFCINWYREEKKRNAALRAAQEAQDKDEENQP